MRKFLMSFVCFMFLFGGVSAFAEDDSLKKVTEKGELVVGFCAAYPPFESKNEKTGEFEGFDIDLARAISGVMGLKVCLVDAEWQGLLGGLGKGDFDVLITCMSKSETREQNVNFSDIYYELRDVIVVKADNDSIKTEEDLKDKVVGVQMGSASEQIADKMKGLKEIRRFNYNPEAFLDLQHGRIDALLVGYAYAINQMKVSPGVFKIEAPLGDVSEIVMVFPKGADELTKAINNALKTVKEKGIYDELVKRWLLVEQK